MDKKIFLQTMKKYDYVMLDTNGVIDDEGVVRFLELVEREAAQQGVQRIGDTAPRCIRCGNTADVHPSGACHVFVANR